MMRSRFPKRPGRGTVELTGEFFEEDEPVGRVRGAFESGKKRVTGERVEVDAMLAEGQPVEITGPPADSIRRNRVRRWLVFWSGTR